MRPHGRGPSMFIKNKTCGITGLHGRTGIGLGTWSLPPDWLEDLRGGTSLLWASVYPTINEGHQTR